VRLRRVYRILREFDVKTSRILGYIIDASIALSLRCWVRRSMPREGSASAQTMTGAKLAAKCPYTPAFSKLGMLSEKPSTLGCLEVVVLPAAVKDSVHD
jgi:hypothetical protein